MRKTLNTLNTSAYIISGSYFCCIKWHILTKSVSIYSFLLHSYSVFASSPFKSQFSQFLSSTFVFFSPVLPLK